MQTQLQVHRQPPTQTVTCAHTHLAQLRHGRLMPGNRFQAGFIKTLQAAIGCGRRRRHRVRVR